MNKDDATPVQEERSDPFASLSDFKPKSPEVEGKGRALDKDIQKISEDNGFLSRQAKPSKRPRFNSSGPKEQLNIKVSRECHERFYEMARTRNIRVLGDLIEQALEALDELHPIK